MDKQEIVIWLNNNADKQENEIKAFLLSKMQEVEQKESWQKDYFLRDLKRLCKDCPASILKIINDLEKENKGQIKKEENYKRERYFAFLIDLFLPGVILWPFTLFFNFNIETAVGFSLFLIAWLFYFSFATYKFGCTLGQYFLKLRVVDEKTNNNPSFVIALTRELLFLTTLTGIGYIYFLLSGYYWDRITKISIIKK